MYNVTKSFVNNSTSICVQGCIYMYMYMQIVNILIIMWYITINHRDQ